VFCFTPWNSVLRSGEAERIAANIMTIRARLGNKWELTWDEYKTERLKDGTFSYCEQPYFEDVIKVIPDAIGAISFSQDWANAAREALAKQKES
jgi:hypothetical protein